MANVENFYLNNFMNNFKGGARPNQFKVELSLPARLRSRIRNSANAQNQMKFMIKAASIPASNLGMVDVPFRGRQFKVAGDRTFDQWNVTALNDVDFDIRNAFEQWSDLIIGHVNHGQADEVDNQGDYMADAEVHQLDRNGKIIKSYNFVGIWPSNIGEIALSFDSNDQVEEFPVTLNYQWWESNTTRDNTGGTETGDNGGQAVI